MTRIVVFSALAAVGGLLATVGLVNLGITLASGSGRWGTR